MRILLNLILLYTILFSSCDPNSLATNPAQMESYVPVYSKDLLGVKQIKTEPARSTINGGKIYTVGNLLFQVEKDSGIHVINYANPASPQKLAFIKSYMCKELSVKDGYLYTNNFSDLVVIDIKDMANIHEVNRTADVFPDLALQYPAKTNPFTTIYFECPDPSKGVIIGWKKQTLNNPKCWR